jgi:hypothetical protein
MRVMMYSRFLFVIAIGAISLSAFGAGSVYRCEVQGKVTFSDHACDQASDKTEVDTELRNTYVAPTSIEQQSPAAAHKLTRAEIKRKEEFNERALWMFNRQPNEQAPSPKVNKSTASQATANQVAIKNSPNYRAGAGTRNSTITNSPNYDTPSSSTGSESSIAASQARHREDCKKVAAELYDANHTETEIHYSSPFPGHPDTVEDLGKDQKKIAELEKKRKQQKCFRSF